MIEVKDSLFSYKNVTFSNQDDASLFKLVLEPKGDKLKFLSTFTYLTPNHVVLPLLHKISELTNKGCYAYLLIWDMNIINYGSLLNNDFDVFTKNKINELTEVLCKLGAKKSNFTIITVSDAWKRFINVKKPNLYLIFFKLINEFNNYVSEFNNIEKIKYFIQYPADILFSQFFNLLYPEEEVTIDFVLSGDNRKPIYELTKKILFAENVIKSRFPIPVYINRVPRINFNDIYPTWDMTLDDITSVVISDKSFSLEHDLHDLATVLFNIIDYFEYDDKKYDLPSFLKLVEESKNPKILVSELLFYFFRELNKSKNITNNDSLIKKISSLSELRDFSSLFKDQYSVSILNLADGSLTLTDMSKKLKMPASNLHKYLKKLINVGFISYTHDKRIIKRYDALKINLNNIH